MGFLKDIPDYKNYSDDEYNMNIVPDKSGIWDTLQAYANKSEDFRYVVMKLRDIALLPPTTNIGHSWLVGDLQDAIYSIRKKTKEGKIALFYDAVAVITEAASIDEEEINEFLAEHNLGYLLESFLGTYYWRVRDNTLKMSKSIDETISVIEKSDFEQAIEHIQQAKMQLENANDERSRKNAVRDCASAMESIIKNLGGINDIGKATKALRESNKWGLDAIVKDGNNIFDRLHEFYPDFRHGSSESSSMSINEALYWVGRMTVFINYVVAQKKQVDLRTF